MKVCDIAYKLAKERHPIEVKAIIAKLRKGTSIHNKAAGNKLKWHYECCVSCESFSIADLFNGKAIHDKNVRNAMSLEDKIKDQVERTQTSLRACIGRWWDGELVETNPPEVETQVRHQYQSGLRTY